MSTPRMYGELADWFPLLTPVEEYRDEAAFYASVLRDSLGGTGREAGGPASAREDARAGAAGPAHTVLELGSGGGHNAAYLAREFTMTLSDLSPQMLALSRRRHPDLEHVEGDMRSLRLGRAFDAVFVHDAVMYLTTEADLRAAMVTAWEHLRPGAAAVFVPDATAENHRPATDTGGEDGEGRGLRFLEWVHPPVGSTYRVTYAIALREGDDVRVVHDEHVQGVFSRDTWLALLADVGFDARGIEHHHGYDDPAHLSELFVGVRPA